jgi:hypothetical protein
MLRQHITPVLRLLQRLQATPLDKAYDRYGGFVCTEGPVTTFFGQFLHTQEIFWIETDDAAVACSLQNAITANQLRDDYRSQTGKPPLGFDAPKLSIHRKRFSETQGEVELRYDDQRLEQFGDRILLTAFGWRGYPDSLWHVTGERMAVALATRADSPFNCATTSGGLQ